MTQETAGMIIEATIQRHAKMLKAASVKIDDRFFDDLGRALKDACRRDGLDPSLIELIDRAIARVKAGWNEAEEDAAGFAAIRAAV